MKLTLALITMLAAITLSSVSADESKDRIIPDGVKGQILPEGTVNRDPATKDEWKKSGDTLPPEMRAKLQEAWRPPAAVANAMGAGWSRKHYQQAADIVRQYGLEDITDPVIKKDVIRFVAQDLIRTIPGITDKQILKLVELKAKDLLPVQQ
jgi:hypothetical protein